MATSLRERIAQEARTAFPRECCGLIEGLREKDAARVTAIHPTRNLACEADRFEIDPLEQFALLRASRGRGNDIIGCYHSHPNGRAEPSARDLANAGEEDFIWVIAAAVRDAVGLRAFSYRRNAFFELAFSDKTA